MKKLNLILGILCLLAAIGLVTANLRLPPESLMFDIGYGNMPWIPPVIFFIVGIVLLATAGVRSSTGDSSDSQPILVDPEKAAMNKRLENIALGCFLVAWGGSMFWSTLAPGSRIQDGVWSIVVGLIFLGLNGARYVRKIRMSGFTTVLGIISVIGGMVQLFGIRGVEGAFLLIILGAYLILKPWFEEKKLFGKAEQS